VCLLPDRGDRYFTPLKWEKRRLYPGEDLLARYGFVDIQRVDVSFVWEFADPETFARTLASTGPAWGS